MTFYNDVALQSFQESNPEIKPILKSIKYRNIEVRLVGHFNRSGEISLQLFPALNLCCWLVKNKNVIAALNSLCVTARIRSACNSDSERTAEAADSAPKPALEINVTGRHWHNIGPE